eukprot:366229-Chlamydomonas_euryale.AAC.46
MHVQLLENQAYDFVEFVCSLNDLFWLLGDALPDLDWPLLEVQEVKLRLREVHRHLPFSKASLQFFGGGDVIMIVKCFQAHSQHVLHVPCRLGTRCSSWTCKITLPARAWLGLKASSSKLPAHSSILKQQLGSIFLWSPNLHRCMFATHRRSHADYSTSKGTAQRTSAATSFAHSTHPSSNQPLSVSSVNIFTLGLEINNVHGFGTNGNASRSSGGRSGSCRNLCATNRPCVVHQASQIGFSMYQMGLCNLKLRCTCARHTIKIR